MAQTFFPFIKKIMSIAVLAILLTGCSSPPSQGIDNNHENGTKLLTFTPSALPKIATPSSTPLTPQTTPTATIASTFTRTPLSTLILTWTPIPTFSSDKALKILEEYYQNNGGCELPCWWGITPGVTSWQEARMRLSPLAQEYGPFVKTGIPRFDYEFQVPIELAPSGFFAASLWVKDGKVVAIGTNTNGIKRNFDYSLAGLLKAFGQPDEIWIMMPTEAPDNKPDYELDLFFSQKGIKLNSVGQAYIYQNSISFCPQNFRRGDFPPAITLFSPFEGMTYEILTKMLYNREISHLTEFRLLRELTDSFDEANFYNTYIDPTAETCINIQLDKLH